MERDAARVRFSFVVVSLSPPEIGNGISLGAARVLRHYYLEGQREPCGTAHPFLAAATTPPTTQDYTTYGFA